MSEPVLILPTSLEYGYVDARIILAVADTDDEDRLPNAVPATGTITLTPLNDKTVETEEEPVIVGRHSISGTLDATGRLRDSQGQRGLWVITGLYSVSYNLTGVSVGGHSVLVTSDHTENNPLHLATAAQPTGAPLTPTEYQQLSARIDGIPTGVDRAPVTVLTNPTTISTEPAGRLDLVFTEPTTVAFDLPGRTDLVLSIEGYEHVTWEGVTIHGTPSTTQVVWASALWRDRDSTWHLLCEQDATSGGGNVELIDFPFPLYSYEANYVGQKDANGLPTEFELVSRGVTEKHTEMVVTALDPTTLQERRTFIDYAQATDAPVPPFISASLMVVNEDYSKGWNIGWTFSLVGTQYHLFGDLNIYPDSGIGLGWSQVIAPQEMKPAISALHGKYAVGFEAPWGGRICDHATRLHGLGYVPRIPGD